MSSSAPSKRQHAPNTLPAGKGLLDWLSPILNSSVGGKILVALTGLGLVTFVVVHLIGNLKLFAGQDAINSYALFLKNLGPLLWIARIGLLTLFLLHIFLAVRLQFRSKAARPVAYAYPATIQATVASRTMLYTGLVIFAFVLLHLAHYTFGWVTTTEAIDVNASVRQLSVTRVTTNYVNLVDEKGRHDVYSMIVAGFHNPLMCVLYILAQAALFLHLSHGIASTLQTLGLNTPRFQPTIKIVGYVIALSIALGNIALVVAVWGGWVPVVEKFTIGK